MKEIIQRAKDCLEKHEDREGDNIRRAEEAIRFRALDQWPQQVKIDRESANQDGGPRPCPVLDKTNQYVRQLVNEERQNRAAIKIRPVDDNADIKVAEVYTGIIRHIEDQSQAIEAYTTAGEHAIDGGFGYWRILTEYSDPMSFQQDIKIKRIPNRFSVALGPHQEVDASDVKEGLIWEDIPKKEFENKYPKAKPVSFDDSWGSEDHVRVAEYMCIKPKRFDLHMLPSGEIVTELPEGVEPEMTRTSQTNQVYWYKVTSAEVLEEKEMLGSYIPIVKVIGNEIYLPDGKCRLSGAVEAAMDPQRLHNYAHAGFIENVALAPRAPWIAEAASIEGYEQDYAEANRRNITVLKFNQVDDSLGNPVPMPQRIPPAGISSGWQQIMMNTEHGVEATFGMYGPSVGRESQERSGIALQEQKIQGMIGNYHYPDNLARSIQHTGRILLEWIPKIYDTEQVARILGEDGVTDMIYLNPEQEQPITDRYDEFNQKIGSTYNLSVGKYDVTVSTGPSYTSKRQEAFDNLSNIIGARPDLMEVIGDLVFKNMDAPYADDIADRMRTLLPEPIQAMLNEDDPQDPQVVAMMQQIDQASQVLEERAQAVQDAEAALQDESNKVDADKVRLESLRKDLANQQQLLEKEAEIQQLKLNEATNKAVQEIEDAQQDFEEAQDVTQLAGTIQSGLQGLSEGFEEGIGEAIQQSNEVGQLLTSLTEGMQKISEINQFTEAMKQHAEMFEKLIESQSKSRTATMPDGRTITIGVTNE